MAIYTICFATVAALSALLTRVARDMGTRSGMLDVPNDRSSHVRPTPRTGGIAIGFATVIAWVAYLALVGGLSSEVLVLLVGSMFAATLGFVDDARSLQPGPKLLGQAVLAGPAVLLLPMAVPGWPLWVTSVGAIVWILAYTNMFNFMDGSDGLAAGQVVIVGGVLAMFSFEVGNHVLAWFALATAAASAGFLRYNAPPASVFMGDAGSFFLGYTIAVMSLVSIKSGVRPIAVFLLVYPFLFDASYTLLRRLLRRECIWRAHREHLYQRLLVAGLSHEAVARRYYLWQSIAAACAVTYQHGNSLARTAAVAVALLAVGAVLATVSMAERDAVLALETSVAPTRS